MIRLVLWYRREDYEAIEREQSARNERDRIGSKMTREQIAEAQRLAREWATRR